MSNILKMKAFLILLLFCRPVGYRQITWADFQGKPPKESPWKAETVTHIELITRESEGVCAYEVSSYFCPEESWTKSSDPAVLKHEQGHADLAEIWARHMRNDMRQYQHVEKSGAPEAIYDAYCELWKQAEKTYDQQTDHGRDKEKQGQWEQFIKSELIKYQ
jgi:hypothetical protein